MNLCKVKMMIIKEAKSWLKMRKILIKKTLIIILEMKI